MNPVLWLLTLAVIANAVLVGASLDQSIKQLPARHRIGVAAFSEYSKAADLRNGIAWYASLGVGTAVLTVLAAVTGLLDRPGGAAAPLWLSAGFTLAHSFTTSRAAPANFSQRHATGDPGRLTVIFDRFARWQTARVILQILSLLSTTWGLIATISA